MGRLSLAIPSDVRIVRKFSLKGILTPSTITSNQNNFNPPRLANASVLRLETDASRNITGLAQLENGQIMLILNIGLFDLVFIDESTSSDAVNRFALNGNFTLAASEGISLIYDLASTRWRPFS